MNPNITKIHPRNRRLLIEFIKIDGTAIVIPDAAGPTQSAYKFKILEVAPDCEGAFSPGDFIFMNPETRHVIPVTDEPKTGLVHEHEVVCVVEYGDELGRN